MKRTPFLVLTLIAVGTILWVMVFGASGPAPQRGAGRDAPTGRAPPRKRSRRRKRIRIVGHVQTRDGAPVKGATVFVLPKKRPGLDRSDADHEVSDADGQWAIWTRRTVGCWIGVVAPDFRNAWLDGDTVDPAVQMFLIVEPAAPVTVTVRWPDGRPVRSKGVQIEPWPPQATWYLPGPNARQGEQWGVTNDRGEIELRRGTAKPLWLTPQVEGHTSRPAHAWIAGAAARVEFVVLPKAGLDLHLTEAEDGTPITGLVTVAFSDPRTGTPSFAFTESTRTPGHLLLERALPPGSYDVEIRAEGHAAWFRPDVLVRAQEAPTRIEATLPPAPAASTLTLSLVGNAGTRHPGTRQRAPLVFLDRVDPGTGWARRGWRAGAPEAWDPATQRLTFLLAPGSYHVLVADVATGRAALERAVVLTAGATRTLAPRMQPGQLGRLPAMRKDDVYTLSLEASGGGFAQLPVFGGTRGGRLRAARPLDVVLRGLEGQEVYVGPYPLDAFTLHLHRSDGSAAEVAFR